jgi:hypothetical protein
MFATKIATTITLLALTSSSVYLADGSDEDAMPFSKTVVVPMFPDGLKHDFGTVQRGPEYRHTFRIVNTSNVPLQIVSLRRTVGPYSCQLGRSTKPVLQPTEVGQIEVILDTSRFSGPKTLSVWLTVDNGKIREYVFVVTANAQDEPIP